MEEARRCLAKSTSGTSKVSVGLGALRPSAEMARLKATTSSPSELVALNWSDSKKAKSWSLGEVMRSVSDSTRADFTCWVSVLLFLKSWLWLKSMFAKPAAWGNTLSRPPKTLPAIVVEPFTVVVKEMAPTATQHDEEERSHAGVVVTSHSARYEFLKMKTRHARGVRARLRPKPAQR